MKNIQPQNIPALTRTGKVVLIFHENGCFNCKIMEPIFEDLQRAFPLIQFYAVKIDLYPQLAQKYKISSLPTLIPFRYGQKLPAIVGMKSLQVLSKLIDKSLNYA